MAPVHADVVQGAVNRESRQIAERCAQKGGEFSAVHLTRSHRERAMVDRAETTRMTVDRHVIGRVGEDD